MIWYDIKKKKPLAYINGLYDGLKSDKILVFTRSRKYHIVEMYEGVLDRTEFCDFFDENDYQIENVTHWTELTPP